jgi:hypothetical protein
LRHCLHGDLFATKAQQFYFHFFYRLIVQYRWNDCDLVGPKPRKQLRKNAVLSDYLVNVSWIYLFKPYFRDVPILLLMAAGWQAVNQFSK